MFTAEEIEQMTLLAESDKNIAYYFKRIKEEEQLNLSKIFHEIKNPMTLINSTFQLIEALHPDIKNIEYWKTLTEDFTSLKHLLEDLSNYNAGDKLYKEKLNIHKLIEETCDSFKSISINRNIVLIYTNNDYEPIIYCDKIKIKQCLVNIIKNAFEAVDDITGIISISINQTIRNLEEKVDITISDNGYPISPNIISDIFIPFTTHKSGGTGLGLCVTKKIIEAHNGSITVESNDNLTSFTLSIPIN